MLFFTCAMLPQFPHFRRQSRSCIEYAKEIGNDFRNIISVSYMYILCIIKMRWLINITKNQRIIRQNVRWNNFCGQWRRLHRARGDTVSRRTANKKLTKLHWPSRKRSPKRLIVPVEPKNGGTRPSTNRDIFLGQSVYWIREIRGT